MENNKNLLAIFTTTDDKSIAYHVTKDKLQVDDARLNLSKKYNFKTSKLQYMNQIHSNIVYDISEGINPQECDALITNQKNTPLMVMVADCIPILFYDKNKKVIAVAHAGRNGTFLNITSKVIEKMKNLYNCEPKDIEVMMGASIQKCCYEVSQELADITLKNFGKEFVEKRYINLQGINKKQLLKVGILEKNIKISPICTKCSNQNYFSYRKDNQCGRFAGILMLRL